MQDNFFFQILFYFISFLLFSSIFRRTKTVFTLIMMEIEWTLFLLHALLALYFRLSSPCWCFSFLISLWLYSVCILFLVLYALILYISRFSFVYSSIHLFVFFGFSPFILLLLFSCMAAKILWLDLTQCWTELYIFRYLLGRT